MTQADDVVAFVRSHLGMKLLPWQEAQLRALFERPAPPVLVSGWIGMSLPRASAPLEWSLRPEDIVNADE